jgi:hypothetical protein
VNDLNDFAQMFTIKIVDHVTKLALLLECHLSVEKCLKLSGNVFHHLCCIF